MAYDFNNLSNRDFEQMCQSLIQKIIAPGVTIFGDGPDGGREATFEGKAPYPSALSAWSGYWVFQAKFKTARTSEDSKDPEWLQSEIIKEVKKYEIRKSKVRKPDNLIFLTNIILTPAANGGGIDKMRGFIQKITSDFGIKNVHILSYDDLVSHLNGNRDIATAFSSFILSGDILKQLYELLGKANADNNKVSDFLCRYLEVEFKNNLSSKLEHAGKLTDDKINLEKVFIDLYATEDGRIPDNLNIEKFVAKIVSVGNIKLNPSLERRSRYVLIAGPGYGKSTLSQFLFQIYAANFIKNVDGARNKLKEANDFLEECETVFLIRSTCLRIPFRIVLKEYANWITERSAKGLNYSVVDYLVFCVNKKASINIFTNERIEELLKNLSSIIIFDGLDEVPISSNRKEILDEINLFTDVVLRRVDADALFIATSRPQGYSKDFNNIAYSHLYITDLPNRDCLTYINKLLKHIEGNLDDAEKYFKILKNASTDPVIGRLMKSPLQASIMTILVKSGGEPSRNKYELFTDYYTIIFRREKQKGVAKILNEHPTYINAIHYKLGYVLQLSSESKNNPAAYISIDGFRDIVKEYLSFEGLKNSDINLISELIIEAATLRLIFIEEIQDEKIGFNIRSLQEYFAANYLMQNQPDLRIPEKLRNIASSSYWNNTLMFAIGYLFKHKNYAIDHVESIVEELNGSSEDVFSKSLFSIAKCGSWLSLDILNESIFRGHPKYENKFGKKIADLLLLPQIDKHKELALLPENVKKEFLAHYIKQGILSGDKDRQIASWNIYFEVYHTSILDEFEEIKELWPSNQMESKSLFQEINQGKCLLTKFGKQMLIDFIENSSPEEYVAQLSMVSNSSLKEILQSQNYKKVHSAIFASFFLTGFYQEVFEHQDGEFLELAELLSRPVGNVNLTADHYHIFNENYVLVAIASLGYSCRVHTLFDIDQSKLMTIQKMAEYYDVKFILALIDFYRTPNTEKLASFYEEIGRITNETDEYYIDDFEYLNWLFYKIAKSNVSLLQLPHEIRNGHFGRESDWRQFETSLKEERSAVDIPELLSCSNSREINANFTSETVVGFVDLLRSHPKSDVVILEFFSSIDWVLYKNIEDIMGSFVDDEAIPAILYDGLERILIGTQFESEKWRTVSFFTQLLFLTPMDTIFHRRDQIEKICSSIEIAPIYIGGRAKMQREAMFSKILDISKGLVLLKPDSSIVRLFPLLLYSGFSASKTDKDRLNDMNFQNSNNIGDNFSQMILLLYSLNASDKRKSIVETMLMSIDLTDEMLYLLINILDRHRINDNLEKILMILEERVMKVATVRKSYLEVVKFYYESKPSEKDSE